MDQEKTKGNRSYRHRSRNKKKNVEKRMAHEEAEREAEKRGPFKDERCINDPKNKHFEAKFFLESSLIFKRACSEDSCLEDSKAKDFFPYDKGVTIARKLSAFLRHGMSEGQFCTVDGSVEIGELARSIRFRRDWVLLATNPRFDKDEKRRFLVIEKMFPNGDKQIRVAALGGHSHYIPNPPGHYQLGIESHGQIGPLVHNTSEKDKIERSNFLSQMGRQGGINFASRKMADCFRPNASHRVVVDFEQALKHKIFFFGNSFTGISYCAGAWEGNSWNGKLPFNVNVNDNEIHLFHFEDREERK